MATHIGPAQFTIDPGGPSELVIGREDQLEDATIAITESTADHMSQESSVAIDQSFTGLEVTATISIGNIAFDYFVKLLNGTLITDGTTATKKKFEMKDLTGLRLPKKKVLIKPYDGTLPDANTANWYTLLSAGFKTELSLAYGKETQQAYTITMMGFPDPVTRVKVVRGDITAIAVISPTP